MASFWFLTVLLSVLIVPSLASDHHHLNSESSNNNNIMSASPATLSANPPQSSSLSPYQELSPDISPLLPSPGGKLPSPTNFSMPTTIPANPSPPNPDDEFLAPAPDSAAFSPFGSSFPASSMAPANLLHPLMLAGRVAAATYCSIHLILRII